MKKISLFDLSTEKEIKNKFLEDLEDLIEKNQWIMGKDVIDFENSFADYLKVNQPYKRTQQCIKKSKTFSFFKKFYSFFSANSAWSTLSTTFILKKFKKVQHYLSYIIFIRKNNDCPRTYKTTIFF